MPERIDKERASGSDPVARVYPSNGVVWLSKHTLERVDRPPRVRVEIDRDAHSLRLTASDESAEYKLSYRGGAATVSGLRALRALDVDLDAWDGPRTYQPSFDGETVVIELDP
jgi:hypothetical protein